MNGLYHLTARYQLCERESNVLNPAVSTTSEAGIIHINLSIKSSWYSFHLELYSTHCSHRGSTCPHQYSTPVFSQVTYIPPIQHCRSCIALLSSPFLHNWKLPSIQKLTTFPELATATSHSASHCRLTFSTCAYLINWACKLLYCFTLSTSSHYTSPCPVASSAFPSQLVENLMKALRLAKHWCRNNTGYTIHVYSYIVILHNYPTLLSCLVIIN